MMPHPAFLLLGILLLAAAMSMTGERTPRERLYAAIRVASGWAMAAIGGGWLMHWIHG